MDNMTPEKIAKIGPDGTTALMQLFANVKKKQEFSPEIEQLIIHYATMAQKFLLKDVMEASITFGNAAIFETFFNLTVTPIDAMDLARIAVLSEDKKILEIILKAHPQLKPQCQELGRKCQTRPMLEFLGNISSEESELIKMSRKFPKFNEGLEKPINPLPHYAKEVNIEGDIKPLLRDKFCGIVECFGEDPGAVPISKWQPENQKACHGKHQNG